MGKTERCGLVRMKNYSLLMIIGSFGEIQMDKDVKNF